MARRDLNDWFWHVSADFAQLSVKRVPGQVSMAAGRFWQPKVDVLEDERVIVIKAELAGVKIDDLQLGYSPDDHSVMLRGVRREEDPIEMGRTGTHQLEVFYGEFEREIPMPASCAIDPEHIHASLKNGFLIVLVPKRSAKP